MKLRSAKTLNGKSVAIRVSGGKVLVGGATVTKADVMASNGVIHVINKVLIPYGAPARRGLTAPGGSQGGEVMDIQADAPIRPAAAAPRGWAACAAGTRRWARSISCKGWRCWPSRARSPCRWRAVPAMDAVTNKLVAVPDELVRLRIGPLVAGFLFLSALAHALVASPWLHGWYERNVRAASTRPAGSSTRSPRR